jgi:Fic family protein
MPISDNTNTHATYHAVALAAIWLYGLVDVHPFRDGNGRLCRILCNYALKRLLNLPFSITLVATIPQRHDYVEGLRHGHRMVEQLLLSSVFQKQSTNNNDPSTTTTTATTTTTTTTTIMTGVFEPLVDMLLERLANAIHQCNGRLDEKSRARRSEEEAQVARRVRERAAAGRCVICLDEDPNIATLCCGQRPSI